MVQTLTSRRRQLLQRGVQRGGLARAGRPGDQNDAVGLAGHVLPAVQVIGRKAQLIEVLEQHFRVEIRIDHFFAKRGGQGRTAAARLRRRPGSWS